VNKRWAKGEDGETKTETSDGYVPLHPMLAAYLQEWKQHTPYSKDKDFVFPSLRAEGEVPVSASIFCNNHLRPAPIAAGVRIEKGQRFGLHNLRHSLSNWLMKQGEWTRRPCRRSCVTARFRRRSISNTQKDADEARAAQGAFLATVGFTSELVQ
jgi:integrase